MPLSFPLCLDIPHDWPRTCLIQARPSTRSAYRGEDQNLSTVSKASDCLSVVRVLLHPELFTAQSSLHTEQRCCVLEQHSILLLCANFVSHTLTSTKDIITDRIEENYHNKHSYTSTRALSYLSQTANAATILCEWLKLPDCECNS